MVNYLHKCKTKQISREIAKPLGETMRTFSWSSQKNAKPLGKTACTFIRVVLKLINSAHMINSMLLNLLTITCSKITHCG